MSDFKQKSLIWTQESDFGNVCPILDSSVRFKTQVSDFGHKSLILETCVRFWIVVSVLRHKCLILDTNVRFLTIVSNFGLNVQNRTFEFKIGHAVLSEYRH